MEEALKTFQNLSEKDFGEILKSFFEAEEDEE